MEFENSIQAKLSSHGVGRRNVNDDFFKKNQFYNKLEKCLGIYDFDNEELCHSVVNVTCHIPGCWSTFNSLMNYEDHYNTVHRYLCSQCKKNLPSSHLLDLHFAENHDSFFAVLAERGPAYACYVKECTVKFLNPEERKHHCIEEHKFPTDFRFDNKHPKKKGKACKLQNKKQQRNSSVSNQSEEMVTDDSAPNVECAKPAMKNFSFGHAKNKGFSKACYTGKVFTNDNKKKKNDENNIRTLESEDMFTDLKNSLPDC